MDESLPLCILPALDRLVGNPLGLFIRRNEEDDKIVNFLLKTEIEEVVDYAFSSDVLIRTSLKDVAQVFLDFRQIRVANKLHLSSRESIYVVVIDYFLNKVMIYRSGMKHIFEIRYCILAAAWRAACGRLW